MKMFVVPVATNGALVTNKRMKPFTTRSELTFELEEIAFDPVSCVNRPDDYTSREREMAKLGLYGFTRSGPSGQKYTLIVPGKSVTIL